MKLQELRQQAKLSQSELARLSGVKVRSIQEFEYGRRSVDTTKLATLVALADALQEPLYNLLDDKELAEKVKNNVKREV